MKRKYKHRYPPEHTFFDRTIFGWHINIFLDDYTFFLYVTHRTKAGEWRGFRFSPEAGSMWLRYMDNESKIS